MSSKPVLVGITGGIGSGKSTVCKVFELLGIPVYNADDRAKHLTATDSRLRDDIITTFGVDAYDGDKLNRTYMARQVFGNTEKLARLNSLIHPRVAEDFKSWVLTNHDKPYLMKEAALIFETQGHLQLDKVITVTAPQSIRIKRVLRRDAHRTEEDIRKIISNQMPEEEKANRADFVIENDGQQMVIPQVLKIHDELLCLQTS